MATILPLCDACAASVRRTAGAPNQRAALVICDDCFPKLTQCLRVMLSGHPCIVRQVHTETLEGDGS